MYSHIYIWKRQSHILFDRFCLSLKLRKSVNRTMLSSLLAFLCRSASTFWWNGPKLMEFIVGSFLFEKQVTCFSPKWPILLENLEIPHFQNMIGKWGISRKNHLNNFKTGKEPKMNLFDFGSLQRKMPISSRDKYLIDMLFGAFHGTSHNSPSKTDWV